MGVEIKPRCEHKSCHEESNHCILEALWLNPPEFDHQEPIVVAIRLQDEANARRAEYLEAEERAVTALWILVDMGRRGPA